MYEAFSTLISEFIHDGRGNIILLFLVFLTTFFLLTCCVLFLITIFLRIKNKAKEKINKKRMSHWDPYLLAVMDGSMSPGKAAEKIKKRNSLPFLLYLEQYIYLLRGKEKERLEDLGRLSSKKLQSLLHCPFRRRRILGMHLLVIFHARVEGKITLDAHDKDLSLLSIRELRTIPQMEIKKQIIQFLSTCPYLSPVYMSNILADMGVEIIPILKDIIKNRNDHPFMQIVAIDTLRRMHDAETLHLTDEILQKDTDPGILRTWLKYIEDSGNRQYVRQVRPFIHHPSVKVRLAAIRAYIELSDALDSEEIIRFFNDVSVKVAINAAEKLRNVKNLPYIPIDKINEYRWGDIFLKMVY